MSKLVGFAGFVILFSAVSWAQTPLQNKTTTSTSIFAQPTLLGGIKSYNDSGRIKELQDPAGRQYKSKNEYFLGAKSQAGWGFFAQGVETSTNYGAGYKNTFSAGDPSFSILHPVYKSDKLTVTGMFREYFPISNYSVTNHIWQQAYYNFIVYKLPHRWDLNNSLIPRYYSADHYNEVPGKSPDTTVYAENFLAVSRRVNNWFRFGLGSHGQIEAHQVSPVGKTLELYPLADFMISNTIYLGPRIYFPVAVQNSVYDAPTAVSMDNAQAEVFVQATL